MSKPAIVPRIADRVVRLSPWVRTNDTSVTTVPSPIASTSGFQPARSSGIRTRIASTSERASATSDRTPRQPATAIVTIANRTASPPMSGKPPAIDDRERRRTVGLLVDRDDDLVADHVVRQLELARRSLEIGCLALSRGGVPPGTRPSPSERPGPFGGWSSTIRAWIRSETRPCASAGVRSGSRTRNAAMASSPSPNRTISRSVRRRPPTGRPSLRLDLVGVGSTVIGGSLPSAARSVPSVV